MSDRWVLDAGAHEAAGMDDGTYPFCPLEGDPDGEFSVMVGLTFIGDRPPYGEFVGVVHDGGDEAVQRWCDAHRDFLETL